MPPPCAHRQVDWRQQRHWRCNDNVHPSRHGTYDQISMHPFETVFVKASWHVGEPFVGKYTQWMLAQVRARVLDLFQLGGSWLVTEALGVRMPHVSIRVGRALRPPLLLGCSARTRPRCPLAPAHPRTSTGGGTGHHGGQV